MCIVCLFVCFLPDGNASSPELQEIGMPCKNLII